MPELRQEYAQLIESDIAAVTWAEAADVRARGDRRRRTFALATPAAAVLALAFAGSVVLLANRDTPVKGAPELALETPSATPSPSPRVNASSPTHVVTSADVAWIPAEALPPKADVGKDLVVSEVKEVQPQPDTADWIFAADGCAAYATLNLKPATYLFKLSQKVRRAGPGSAGPPIGTLEVRRYAAKDAVQVLSGVRRVVEACPSYLTSDSALSTPDRPAVNRRSYVVLATDFAGNESLLMQGTVQAVAPDGTGLAEPVVTMLAVIRVDDLITIVDLGLNDRLRTTDLAKVAARRLCAATPTC